MAAALHEFDTMAWVRGLDDEFYDKLTKVGLVPERDRAIWGEFVESDSTPRYENRHK